MKKIFSIGTLAMLMMSFNAYCQSNLNWVVKDNVQNDFFKSHTTLNTSITGFSNKTQADAFINQLRANSEVMSVEVSNTDASGNGDLKLTMKAIHDDMYYIGLAQKMGVEYVTVNGQKKTPMQLREDARKDTSGKK